MLPQSSPLPIVCTYLFLSALISISNPAPKYLNMPSQFKMVFVNMLWRKNSIVKNHLPEEREILYHFLNVLAFLDTPLHFRAGVHLSEKMKEYV